MSYLYFSFIFFIPFVFSEKLQFVNYSLFKVIPENVAQNRILQGLQENDPRFDFWSSPGDKAAFVNIMSSPENKEDLDNFLTSHGINYEIVMTNVQDAINKEKLGTYIKGRTASMRFDVYYSNEEINAWIDDLASTYPEVTKLIGGVSYEGRDIEGFRISHGNGRRIIFLEGGLHAREWISPATVCFIANELLTSTDPDTRAAAREFDWYIFPVTNPDGYIWSHAENRMWRKNRRPIGAEFGVDLNRNWNHFWLVRGASVDPSTEIYAGPGPFSELESRTLSAYLRTLRGRIDLYLSFHSFGQMLLVPFGNSTGAYANYHDAINIGRRAMGALSVRFGTLYTTGNIAETIANATGGTIDWVKDHLDVPLVYAYELRDQGQYGFLLPPEQILPNSQEVMDSVLELIHQGRRFGYFRSSSGKFQTPLLLILIAAFVRLIWV